ncbi:MAG: 1-acyl-sn-glycerol-3-phosphate acyltransferase [Candidatus Obscuribacterales bacterium]|nr:1-acyl-sn-glycerol-3-phosphate acyltransferase [Candidatus Obscuribacterales bacterium]
MTYAEVFKDYIRSARRGTQFGSSVKTMAKLEPFLGFLFKSWWRVQVKGLDKIPAEGPALIVGNTGGVIPWAGIMLSYAMMAREHNPRRLNICCDMDWVEDERIHHLGRELGFVPWSSENVKRLFAQGELVAVFPEGVQGSVKPFSERYRLRDFDWTRVIPAIEENVPVIPLATLGCEESFPVLTNLQDFAKWAELPAFPVTPFMPWLPFPANVLSSFPVRWKMSVLKSMQKHCENRDETYDAAPAFAREIEGEVQAELNRLLRQRVKAIL